MTTVTTMTPKAPQPPGVLALLARSEAELAASQVCSDPEEEFRHAHLGAIRAAAALVEAEGRPTRRRAPRNVWDMLSLVAPELSGWAVYFAGSARLRAAVDAGRAEVGRERAAQTRVAAEDFLDAVREHVGVDAPAARLALQAS